MKLTTNDVVQIENTYDKKGQLDTLKDKVTGKNYKFERDALDNVIAVYEVDTKDAPIVGRYSESVEYDQFGNVKKKTVTGPVSQVYEYTFKSDSSRALESISVGNVMIKPQLDIYGRNKGRALLFGSTKIAEENIAYRKVGDHATNMPCSVWFGDKTNGTYQVKENVRYAYDKMGNIEKVYENGELAVRYQYDALNRIIREDNKVLAKTYLFVYDNNGNIIKRREFDFTLRNNTLLEELDSTDKSYFYDGDRMMSYGGQSCTYDVVGNPLTYRDKTLTWTNGRQLVGFDGHTFTYDGQGRRLTKDGISFTYDSNGRVIKQSNGLEFFYDHTGVAGVKYNTQTYFYRKDVQGNVIGLIDQNGVVIARYFYDAWGAVHAVTDNNGVEITNASHIANLNPFRYRSCYYDSDIKLYFLKTRYYDPETCRFINADDTSYLDPEKINGLNLYAYCGDNPVMAVDPNGTAWWEWVLGIVIIAAVVALSVITAGIAAPISAALGSGFIGAVVGGAVAGAIGGAITSFGISVAVQGISMGFCNIDWGQVGIQTAVGAITGAIFGGIGGGIKYAKAAHYLKSNGVANPKEVLKNFKGIPSVKTSNGTIGFRYFDNIGAYEKGRWLTNVLTDNPVKDLVLYNNNATMVSKFVIEKGAKYLVGTVAKSPVNAIQFFVANTNWLLLL